jgi:hypothetical protein
MLRLAEALRISLPGNLQLSHSLDYIERETAARTGKIGSIAGQN